MDEQTTVSKNVVDRRSATTHSITGILGILFGLLFGHSVIPASDPDRDLVLVTSTALDRGQVFWRTQVPFWHDTQVVLFTEHYATPCGTAGPESGPFYCPTVEKIYLDLSFLRAIRGELARAYVTAHEIGHHVQKLRHELGEDRPSVDVELEADCYAGTWMAQQQATGKITASDVAAALDEARAVGDDRLAPGSSPEQWTHGSSEQRAAAVMRGLGGQPCDSK